MLIKKHSSYRQVIVICDKELIGKKFEQGKLSLEITENFFKGEEKSEQEILRMIEIAAAEDATFNIVGEKSVALSLKAGIIKQEGIMRIQSVPVALILL